MGFGFFGKHPSFGDFVSHGVSFDLRDKLQTWLTDLLAQAQNASEPDWSSIFEAARPIRFWIGADAFGTCLAGVIMPSSDKVGRKYPLVWLHADQTHCPPSLAKDQSFYDDLEDYVRSVQSSVVPSPADLLETDGLDLAAGRLETSLWAVNPDATPSDLLQAIGTADYTRAACSRSYWWCAADDIRSGAIWSCQGLIHADALLWLMSGVARDTDPEQDTDGAG